MKHKLTVELLVESDAKPPFLAMAVKAGVEHGALGDAFRDLGLPVASTVAVSVEPYQPFDLTTKS